MPPRAFKFELVDGFPSARRRAIGFLLDANSNDLDASAVFYALPPKANQMVRTRFDYWLNGGIHDEYFHGWPNDSTYKTCFSFRWKVKREHNRLYGYICHPKPRTDRGFELCVLVYHATKHQWETDILILNNIYHLQQSPSARMAIAQVYPEYMNGGRNKWKN